jgi:hypothetical protein
MPNKWHDLLLRRVSELDGHEFFPDEPDRELVQFVQVMAQYVPSSMGEPGEAIINAADGDALIDNSRLISRLSEHAPNIANGPVSRTHQHWAVGQSAGPTTTPQAPSKGLFRDPKVAAEVHQTSLNPAQVGLSTSTPGPDGHSMWELYLDLFRLDLMPVRVWNLEILGDPVFEVRSAQDWVRLVEAYGSKVKGLIHPDWSAISADYAGVHFAARAVATIQGFSFETQRGLTAPSFWDIEQTLWLRWVFGSTSAVGVGWAGPLGRYTDTESSTSSAV